MSMRSISDTVIRPFLITLTFVFKFQRNFSHLSIVLFSSEKFWAFRVFPGLVRFFKSSSGNKKDLSPQSFRVSEGKKSDEDPLLTPKNFHHGVAFFLVHFWTHKFLEFIG